METPATLRLTTEQVIALVMQLPPPERQKVLKALQPDRNAWWSKTHQVNERNLRSLAAKKGLDWDAMSEDQRSSFVDGLLHER